MAHEMVHALQGQYLPLDSIFHDLHSNDRLTAAQAILEGQATVASINIYTPGQAGARTTFLGAVRRPDPRTAGVDAGVRRAPLVVREGLIFPYVAGAEFMHWWMTSPGHADTLPYGRACRRPPSRCCIPSGTRASDLPVGLTIGRMPGMIYSDVLGENEIGNHCWRASPASARSRQLVALGWGGISTGHLPDQQMDPHSSGSWSSTTAPRRMRSTVVSVPGFATPSARAIVPNSRASRSTVTPPSDTPLPPPARRSGRRCRPRPSNLQRKEDRPQGLVTWSGECTLSLVRSARHPPSPGQSQPSPWHSEHAVAIRPRRRRPRRLSRSRRSLAGPLPVRRCRRRRLSNFDRLRAPACR